MGFDLKSKHWIIAKGIIFVLLAVLSAVLQLAAELPTWQETLLLLICVLAACRFYYFLFHVLHAYVNPSLKSSGLLDLAKRLRDKSNTRE